MTASSTLAAVGHGDGRWTWPLDAGEFDTTIALRGNERRAIAELGSVNLRRLQRQDALAPGWSAVRRLLDMGHKAGIIPVTPRVEWV